MLGSTQSRQYLTDFGTDLRTTLQPILLPQSLPSQPHRNPDNLIELFPSYPPLFRSPDDQFRSFDDKSGGESFAGLDAGEGRAEDRFDESFRYQQCEVRLETR